MNRNTIDLLFFHRRLKRLVVIELKIGEFRPDYKSQVELYLRWLNKYEKAEGEEAPIALILCAEKSQETIELLELNRRECGSSYIRATWYENGKKKNKKAVPVWRCSEKLKTGTRKCKSAPNLKEDSLYEKIIEQMQIIMDSEINSSSAPLL